MSALRLPVFAATAAAALLAGPGPGTERAPRATVKDSTALVVVLVVDQMRGDYLERFGAGFTGGLRRLARQGAVFTRAYQDHGLTETAPGHATIMSGRHPSSTGIVRNAEGVEDTGAEGLDGGAGSSPDRFVGTTLYDWIKARNSQARVLSVSRKDRSAILLVGRSTAPVFWYERGRFNTSRYYADSLPAWVTWFNNEMPYDWPPWGLLLEPREYPEPDSQPWEQRGRNFAMPYRVAVRGGVALAETPYMDSLTLAFALRGARELGVGRGPGPDMLTIGLSSGDGVGHGWGPDSRELRDYYYRLDRYVGAFLDSLGALVDPARTVVVLTADHGVTPYPEWSRQHGDGNANYVVPDTVIRAWDARLDTVAGDRSWVLYRTGGLVAVDRAALAAAGLDADSACDRLVAALRRVPGVARVDTRRTIERADTTRDVIARRWRHALPEHVQVGALISLRPGMVFGPHNGHAKHGQNADLDAHVTLLLYGAPFRAGQYRQRASTVDLAPTLAEVLGVTPLERVDGRVLREALEAPNVRSSDGRP